MSPLVGPFTAAGDSWLHRRNPVVKFGLVLLTSAVLLAVLDPWTPSMLYVLAVIGVIAGGHIAVSVLVRAHIPFLLFGLSLFVVNAVTRHGWTVLVIGPLSVTANGVAVGASLGMRTLLIGVLASAFVLTTDATRLMTSLHQQLRLSPRLTYAILAGYRMLEQLPTDWVTIRQAQAVREPGRRRGAALPRSPRMLRHAAFTVLVTTLRRAERLATTMETRGLGSGPRTIFRPVPLTVSDAVLTATVLSTITAALVAGALGGWLRGLSALGVY